MPRRVGHLIKRNGDEKAKISCPSPLVKYYPWKPHSGLQLSDVHLPLITEKKKLSSLFKEKSALITITQNSSVKRHFMKLGQARRTKENQCTQLLFHDIASKFLQRIQFLCYLSVQEGKYSSPEQITVLLQD